MTPDTGDHTINGHKLHLTPEQSELLAELLNPELYDYDELSIEQFLHDCGLESGEFVVMPDGSISSVAEYAAIQLEADQWEEHIESERAHMRTLAL